MFHVQNFEISPHDRFFLHGPGPSARDKMWQLNLPTNIYKSSNNKRYQQKTTNLPTIKLNQQKSTNLPTIIYKSSNNKTVPTEIYKSPNKYLQIFQHNKRYQQKPTSTALYWPRTTKYQLGTAYTDPVPPSTNQYRPILTQYHQVPTSTALYWPRTIKYQLATAYTVPVPPSPNQYRPILYCIWWHWVSKGRYWLVVGGTGSVKGSTCWYLMVLGQ